MSLGNKILLGYGVILTFASMILLLLSETGVWPLSVAWVLSPMWGGWLFLFVVGEALMVHKYFSQGYWK